MSPKFTIDNAKWLLDGFRKFDCNFLEMTCDAASYLADNHTGYLDLSKCLSLSAECAVELARHRGDIELSGISKIDPEVARALARHRGLLDLSGIQTLDVQTATALAEHQGHLHLNFLSEPKADVLKALAPIRYALYLDGITKLDTVQALALRSNESTLSLSGISELNDEVARILGDRIGGLLLDSLTNLTPVAAASFAKATALSLRGLESLSCDLARELSNLSAELDLSGLKDLSAEAALHLGRHKGFLLLNGISHLTESTAANLAHHQGEISLDELIQISEPVAKALVKHKGRLDLNGITEIDEVVAAVLGPKMSEISLLGLNDVTPNAALMLGVNLFKKSDAISFLNDPESVDFSKYTHISEESIAEIRDYFHKTKILEKEKINDLNFLRFPSVRAISDEVASRLSEASHAFKVKSYAWQIFRSSAYLSFRDSERPCFGISLPGIKSIDFCVAKALAVFSGDIDLSGIEEISEEAARLLCCDDGRQGWQPAILNLNGLANIGEEVAYYLSCWKGWSLSLDGIRSLSPEAAIQLGKFRGRIISLRGLNFEKETSLPFHFSGFIEFPETNFQSYDEIVDLARCSCVSINVRKNFENRDHEIYLSAAKQLSFYRGILTIDFSHGVPDPNAVRELAKFKGLQLAISMPYACSDQDTLAFPEFFESLACLDACSLHLSHWILDNDSLLALSNLKIGISFSNCKTRGQNNLIIDSKCGEVFSRFKSKWLVIENPELNEDGCAAINDYRGWLVLDELEIITSRQAYLLSLLLGKVLSFPMLEANEDVIDQLVKFNGYIDLAGVRIGRFVPDRIKQHNKNYDTLRREFKELSPLFYNIQYWRHEAYQLHNKTKLVEVLTGN